jgi:urease accessory protein
MTEASHLLRLMWLASPALPVGAFSYSEGLESACEQGWVRSEQDAGDWLRDQLHLALGRNDLPACLQAHQAWQARDLSASQAINDWVLNTRESAEMLLQTRQMGRSLTDWLRQGADAADTRVADLSSLPGGPTWPVAFGLASALTGASAPDAGLSFAFGWAEAMVQAAIKAVPLGQAAAQRVLARLVDEIAGVVDSAMHQRPAGPVAFTPLLAILSAQHETQYSRLFRS